VAETTPGRPGLFHDRWKVRTLLICLILAAYSNTFTLGLAMDGLVILDNDSRIQEPTASNLKLIFTRDYWWPSPVSEHYRPVTTLSYLVNYSILGNQHKPAGYHAVNFGLQCIAVLLAFEVGLLLFGSPIPAFFAAALWGVHPVATDVVPNLVGRADILAVIALFACILLHSRAPRPRTVGAFFVLALLGPLSKETALTLGPILLLFDALDPKPWAHKLRQKWPLYAAAAIAGGGFLIARHAVLQLRAWPIAPNFDNPIFAADFWSGRLTAIKVLGLDLWLMIFPWNLSSDRSYNQIPLSSPTDPWVWVALASLLLVLGLAIAARRRMPLLLWSAGFAAITLLPTANLLIPIGSIMSERFLYLPAFAFTVAVTALAFRLIPAHLAVRVVAVLVVLLGARTFARNFDWQDNLSLMKHDAESAPASFKTHDLLARSLCHADDRANIDRCIQESEIAVRILEGLPPEQQFDQTLTHLGLYYSLKGDQLGGAGSAAATPWYEKALAMLLRAKAVSALSEKAFLRDQETHGRPFRMRIAFQPIYRDLATVYRRLGRNAEAVAEYRAGLAVKPEAVEYYPELAGAFLAMNQPGRAAVTWLERMLTEGVNPLVIANLTAIFAKVPGGECAIVNQGGFNRLNLACPALRAATCVAAVNLENTYQGALQPEKAAEVAARASREYGCAR
jgi:tetratricopeptide (TPR) repeat protein